MREQTIHEKYPLRLEHLIKVMDFFVKKHCRYFSIEDVLHGALTNPKIPGGWAYEMKEQNINPENLPFFHSESHEIKTRGENKILLEKEHDLVNYGTVKQLKTYILGKSYDFLTAIKVVCSSFFLSEVMFFIKKSEYGLFSNTYFENLEEFKIFCRVHGIESEINHWNKFSEIYDAYRFFSAKFPVNILNNSFLLIHENVFCQRAIVFDISHKDQFNTDFYYYTDPVINIKRKKERNVFVVEQNISDLYNHYMKKVLCLNRKCKSKIVYKTVINFLKKIPDDYSYLNLILPFSLNLLEQLRSQVVFMQNQVFKKYGSENVALFFYTKNSEISIIKEFASQKSMNSILLLNLTNCEESYYTLNKKRLKRGHILKY